MPTVGIYNETGQHGDYNQVEPVWKGGLAVAPGDLVYRDNADGYDKAVANYPWNTNIATTAAALNALIRGVSMAKRTTLQTTDGGKADGMILYTGEFTFPCTALGAAAKPGDLVSVEDFGNSTVANQKVRVTATAAEAIGRVSRDAAVGATFLTFVLLTPLMFGGPTAAA
jgi:hypothetical protein